MCWPLSSVTLYVQLVALHCKSLSCEAFWTQIGSWSPENYTNRGAGPPTSPLSPPPPSPSRPSKITMYCKAWFPYGHFDSPDCPPKGGMIGAILVIRGVSIWSQGSFDRQSCRDHSQMSLINWSLAPTVLGTYLRTYQRYFRVTLIIRDKKCLIAPITRIVWDRTWAILAMAIASIVPIAGIADGSVSIWSSHVLRTIGMIEAIIWKPGLRFL